MDKKKILKYLLNIDHIEKNWFLRYGITKRRKDSLLKCSDHKGSLFNTNSESTLSLFMFGNIDRWTQLEIEDILPRKRNSRWNPDFFQNLEKSNLSNIEMMKGKKETYWQDLKLAEIFKVKKESLKNNILLFEVEFYNKNLHGNGNKKDNISFLDIKDQNSWTRYDVVIIFPDEKKFVFIESKYKSDISTTTKHFPKIGQMIRGLETAFLTTNHHNSRYSDWDFTYIMLGQKLLDDYSLTKYNNKLDDLGSMLVKYNDRLNKKYRSSTNEDCYPHYFGKFIKKVPKRVKKLYWKDLGNIIKKQEPRFFSDYFKKLEEGSFDKRTVNRFKLKLREAGIHF